MDGKAGSGAGPEALHFLEAGGNRLATLSVPAGAAGRDRPTVLFLGGFRSNMRGEKARHLAQWCGQQGLGFVRLDYSGHGESGGTFADGTIGRWRDDALAVADEMTQGPLIVIGSSMGAWIAVLTALARPERVAGLLGIAAAPDFTEDLIPARLGEAGWRELMSVGRFERPSAYGGELDILTSRLIEEARGHLVLRAPVALDVPLRLIHGLADPDVPWAQSRRLLDAWQGTDAELVLVKDGDHRLSRPADLARMSGLLAGLIE